MFQTRIIKKQLHFKQPAGTSRGVYTTRNVWYILLTDTGSRHYGVGECAPLPALSCDDIPSYDEVLATACKNLEKNGEIDREALLPYPSILFGMETALLHFRARSLQFWHTPFSKGKEGIPINIRNTNAPEDRGTWIVESTCQKSRYTITGIAGKRGFCSINIEKDMMNAEVGFGRKVLQVFEENGISFEHMPSGIDTLTVFVHLDEFIEKEQKVVAGLHRLTRPDSIDIESDLALIAVVGRGMRSTRGTAGRIFSALAHANVNVKMIDQGSSELNIIIGVSDSDFEAAIKAIYDIFVVSQL